MSEYLAWNGAVRPAARGEQWCFSIILPDSLPVHLCTHFLPAVLLSENNSCFLFKKKKKEVSSSVHSSSHCLSPDPVCCPRREPRAHDTVAPFPLLPPPRELAPPTRVRSVDSRSVDPSHKRHHSAVSPHCRPPPHSQSQLTADQTSLCRG